MLLIRTASRDPWRNLAAEEYLLDRVGSLPLTLFLWQSRPAVILGKNQNPWLECRPEDLRQRGVVLARRLSGGGAVYHDEGNLNFAFIMRREEYDIERQGQVVLKALQSLGVMAESDGRNSLMARGMKFSGNAFCFRRGAALHHGTVLVSADLEALGECLRPEDAAIDTRAIRSVPSRVVNLSELSAGISIGDLVVALGESAVSLYGTGAEEAGEEFFDEGVLDPLRERCASWEWTFGRTPYFTATRPVQIGSSRVVCRMEVRGGCIDTCEPVSLVRDEQGLAELQRRVIGRRFTEAD